MPANDARSVAGNLSDTNAICDRPSIANCLPWFWKRLQIQGITQVVCQTGCDPTSTVPGGEEYSSFLRVNQVRCMTDADALAFIDSLESGGTLNADATTNDGKKTKKKKKKKKKKLPQSKAKRVRPDFIGAFSSYSVAST